MGYETARQAIEGRLNSNWTSTNIKWNNVPFIVPDDGSSWIRLHVADAYGFNDCLGGLRQRYTGIIVIELYAKEGVGTAALYGLADAAQGIFSNAVFSGIHCEAGYVQDLGTDEQWKGWYRLNALIPFYRHVGGGVV
jgi:hypothetical protein